MKMSHILSKTVHLYRTVYRKNIISGPITRFILARNNMHLTNKTSVRAQERFRLKDNISRDYKLIYRDQNLIIALTSIAYHFALIGIVVSISGIAYLFYDIFILRTPELETFPDNTLNMKPLSHRAKFDVLCVGTIGVIALLVFSSVIPFRIYHNPIEKLYKVIFVKNIFKKRQVVTFAESTAVPVFKNGRSLFRINNNRMILLDEDCFPVPAQRLKMIKNT